jgi:alpha-L-fucosidase
MLNLFLIRTCQAQLRYVKSEIVALTHFNMATFFRDGDPACDASNWEQSKEPASFAPLRLNVSNWVESYQALGAKSAVLTAKHGCGFFLWKTNVTLPNGSNYGYHVGGAGGLGVDVTRAFYDAVTAAGLSAGFYFSLVRRHALGPPGGRLGAA